MSEEIKDLVDRLTKQARFEKLGIVLSLTDPKEQSTTVIKVNLEGIHTQTVMNAIATEIGASLN